MVDGREALRFEEAYALLERTLDELRQEGLALDRALALYEQGTRLAAHCDRLLAQAELRVTELTPRAGGAAGDGGDETVVRVVREVGVVAGVESDW